MRARSTSIFVPLHICRSALTVIEEAAIEVAPAECIGLLASAPGAAAITVAETMRAQTTRARAEVSPLAMRHAIDALLSRDLVPRGLWHSHGQHPVGLSPTDDDTIRRLLPAMAGTHLVRDTGTRTPTLEGPNRAAIPLTDGRVQVFTLVPRADTALVDQLCWTTVRVNYVSPDDVLTSAISPRHLSLRAAGVELVLGIPQDTILISGIEDRSHVRVGCAHSLIVNVHRERCAQCVVIVDLTGESFIRLGACDVVETSA